MNWCCLIFPVLLISLGITPFNHPCLYFIPLQVENTNYISRPVDSEKTVQSFTTERVIQVGAFRLEPNALNLRARLSALINKPVIIVIKDGYFKVQVTGFTSPEEIEILLPTLGLFGIKNIWILPEKRTPEVRHQIIVHADTTIKMTMVKLEMPVVEELKPFISRSAFTLQVGVFHNRAKALRARKRITNRLGLPVKIVQEWEYYRVLITGFVTMEETFKYYPRLAGMGYPNIIMTEAY